MFVSPARGGLVGNVTRANGVSERRGEATRDRREHDWTEPRFSARIFARPSEWMRTREVQNGG